MDINLVHQLKEADSPFKPVSGDARSAREQEQQRQKDAYAAGRTAAGLTAEEFIRPLLTKLYAALPEYTVNEITTNKNLSTYVSHGSSYDPTAKPVEYRVLLNPISEAPYIKQVDLFMGINVRTMTFDYIAKRGAITVGNEKGVTDFNKDLVTVLSPGWKGRKNTDALFMGHVGKIVRDLKNVTTPPLYISNVVYGKISRRDEGRGSLVTYVTFKAAEMQFSLKVLVNAEGVSQPTTAYKFTLSTASDGRSIVDRSNLAMLTAGFKTLVGAKGSLKDIFLSKVPTIAKAIQDLVPGAVQNITYGELEAVDASHYKQDINCVINNVPVVITADAYGPNILASVEQYRLEIDIPSEARTMSLRLGNTDELLDLIQNRIFVDETPPSLEALDAMEQLKKAVQYGNVKRIGELVKIIQDSAAEIKEKT